MNAKKKRNLVVMLVIMVILIGALVVIQFVNKNKSDDGSDTGYQGELISNFKPSEISKVSYQYRDGEKLNYKYVKETWYNADDDKFPLSSSAFANNFITAFLDTKTSRVIEQPEDESNYGFDDPYLTLNVENIGGKVETFYIGDYNSMLGEYYLKIEGKDKIYTIGTDLIYICRADMYDYATLEAFPSYSKDTLTDLTVKNHDVTVSFTYFADGYETDLIGQCKWFFGKPFSYYRSAETNKMDDLESDVLSLMQFSKLVNYKATKDDIEAYGLNNSDRQYIINDTVTDEETGVTTKRSQIVDFGNYDEESDCYYARVTVLNGDVRTVSPNVYLISKTSVDSLLGIDPLDYVYKQVVYVKLVDVADENSNITIQTPDGEFVLKNKTTFNDDGTEKENIYTLNDQSVEESAVEGFYYEILADCGMERIIYDRSTIVTDKEPTYTIIYNRNKDEYKDTYFGQQIVVTYTEYDTNYYQASVNGNTDILVNRRMLDETMAELPEMLK